jgi:hypothetical protein
LRGVAGLGFELPGSLNEGLLTHTVMRTEITEADWLGWDGDPGELIERLTGKVGSRKLRLFYCACVRQVWSLLKDERSQQAVEASELFADGLLDVETLIHARKAGYSASYEAAIPDHRSPSCEAAAAAFMCANDELIYASGVPTRVAMALGDLAGGYKMLSDICRDVIGNPFRPAAAPALQSVGRCQSVIVLAQRIYSDRAFHLLPHLAQELAQAGCQDSSILSHCLQPGPHARGCWVVDLLLDKQ